MDINSAIGLLQFAANLDEDSLMAAKVYEVLILQKNMVMLSKLSPFQVLLDDVYEICRPSLEDYADRKDLIRIFNEIAKEMYGNSDQCPVVENFGSFLMDMFNAKSDLDLSINFSDQSFEADRVAKIKTLRKFAKKFYALRKGGHVTTVELILSARVPVLKVTDSGSGIECDFSVGNRDGVAKSHIIFIISSIDERFQKLSFMVKAWAKAQDINSSKDGTLNSLSLILLVAFHLQTRDIPILPPFSAILRDGMDLAAVVRLIPSFLSYGERNNESVAELFVSLLVKLESVESLWSKGLCASTYEGSWIYRNCKATGYICIEDFTDRSQNTARAVKAENINKIFSCIRRAVEQIRSFTEGMINANTLKKLLFGNISPQTKKIANVSYSKLSEPVSENTTPRKKKRPTQGDPAEGQRPVKQSKYCHNLCDSEAPTPSRTGRVKKKSKIGKKSGTVTSEGPAERQIPAKHGKHCQNPGRVKTMSGTGKKPDHVTSDKPVEGQRPGKGGKQFLNPCSSEALTPSKTGKVEKKSKTGRKAGPETSNGGPAEGQKPGKQGKKFHNPCSSEAPTPSKTGRVKKKSKTGRKTGPMASDTLISTSFQGLDKSQETLSGSSCQPLPLLPIQGSSGFRPQIAEIGALNSATQRTHGDTLNHAKGQPASYYNPCVQGSKKLIPDRARVEASRPMAPNCPPHQPNSFSGYGGIRPEMTYFETMKYTGPNCPQDQPHSRSNHLHVQGFGGAISERTHVETLRHASNLPAGPLFSVSNPPIQGYGGAILDRSHVETSRHASTFPAGPPFSVSNPLTQGYGGGISERGRVETSKHASNFPAGPPFSVSNPSIQGYGGVISERGRVETSKHASNLPAGPPFSVSNPSIQGHGGPVSERSHVETLRHAFNHPVGPPVSVTNPSVQGHGRLIPDRKHGETVNYQVSEIRSLPPANLAAGAGYGPERTHAGTVNHATPSLQRPVHYTLSSTPSSAMPPHQPYNSVAPCTNPSGLQRSHYPRQYFPHASQFSVHMRPYQS